VSTQDLLEVQAFQKSILHISPSFSRKVFTGVACVGAGIQGVFFTTYDIEGFEGKEHVFSDIQRFMRKWVDRSIYGIDNGEKKS